MPNQVRVGVGVTGASKASSDLDRFRDKFTNLQKQGAKGLAIGAGIGVFNAGVGLATEALGGLTSAFFDSIKAASDLNETENKSAVVFGSVRIYNDPDVQEKKTWFFNQLLERLGDARENYSAVYTMLDHIILYEVAIEILTGKINVGLHH